VIDEDKIVVTLFSKKQIRTHLSSKMNETPGILRGKELRKRTHLMMRIMGFQTQERRISWQVLEVENQF
jgi:hypothetical protein